MRSHCFRVPGICSLLPCTAIIGSELLAIAGTRIEAVASRKQVVTKRLAEQMAVLDQKIEGSCWRWMNPTGMSPRTSSMRGCGRALGGIERATPAVAAANAGNARAGPQAACETEPEARLMRTPYHGLEVAYNARMAVDG